MNRDRIIKIVGLIVGAVWVGLAAWAPAVTGDSWLAGAARFLLGHQADIDVLHYVLGAFGLAAAWPQFRASIAQGESAGTAVLRAAGIKQAAPHIARSSGSTAVIDDTPVSVSSRDDSDA